MPQQVFAQSNNAQELIMSVGNLLYTIMGILFAVALLLFFWGLARFIFKLGNRDASSDTIKDGRRLMIWGVIAMFIISSVWGIVYVLQVALGVETDNVLLDPVQRGIDVPDDIQPSNFPDYNTGVSV